MKTRLLTIVSGAPLPNFIAINELNPDYVHCIFTKNSVEMVTKKDKLIEVFKRIFPSVKFISIPVDNVSNSLDIANLVAKLLDQYPEDHWLLNRTVGTEQMRAPLTAAFGERSNAKRAAGLDNNFKEFFVDTVNNQLAFSLPKWAIDPKPFTKNIDVKTYFQLLGEIFNTNGTSTNTTEQALYNSLTKLSFNDVIASCKWVDNKTQIAEFDVVAIYQYQLYIFERKKLQHITVNKSINEGQAKKENKRQSNDVKHDIEKLAYMRAIFAGHFGKVYWVFSGNYQVAQEHLSRINKLGLQFISGMPDSQIPAHWQAFKLPPPKP